MKLAKGSSPPVSAPSHRSLYEAGIRFQRVAEAVRESTHQIKEIRRIIKSKELDRERGQAIRVVRMSFGVTLGTLAHYFGLSVASLSALERGEHPVSDARVRMCIDAILKVSK